LVAHGEDSRFVGVGIFFAFIIRWIAVRDGASFLLLFLLFVGAELGALGIGL
jgi:hypothetical protein